MVTDWKQRVFRWYTELVAKAPDGVPWCVPAGPLRTLRIALVTTAGVRLSGQAPFDTTHGDPSFREIPANVALADLVPDHTHYDTAPARADLDCVFPLRTLRALAAAGEIGAVAPLHIGFMGYIPDVAPLQREFIPAVARRLRQTGADAVLLSPG